MKKVLVIVTLLTVMLVSSTGIASALITFYPALRFVKTAIKNDGLWDYGASVMKDDSVYKMWWCTEDPNNHGRDAIGYTTSSDGVNWDMVHYQIVLRAYPNSAETWGQAAGHSCDPSVVKVNGTYYMYFTATDLSGTDNRIFLATSPNGTVWTHYTQNGVIVPIIGSGQRTGRYGTGQSSVFYINNTFYHYYHVQESGIDAMYLKLSTDGINFGDANNGNPVLSGGLKDAPCVTYLTTSGQFMVIAAANHLTYDGLYYAFSADGVTWSPALSNWSSANKLLPGNNRGAVHNVAFATDEVGLVSGSSFLIYYGAGDPYPAYSTWDIDVSRLYLKKPADYNGDGSVDLYMLSRYQTGTGKTELHILNGANNFQSWLYQSGTVLGATGTGADWMFVAGDYNDDSATDIYAIKKANTGAGKTEVHILNGVDGFQTFLLQTGTPLGLTGSDAKWMFALGDYNRDGNLDLYCIAKSATSSQTTEVHVLNGADNYQSFLVNLPTLLGQTGIDARWFFLVNDYNADGYPDVYAIDRGTTSGAKITVKILNGANNFQSWLLQQQTSLSMPGTTPTVMFVLADYNKDHRQDLVVIKKTGTSSGKTEVSVLSGASNFQTLLLSNSPTSPLGQTGSDWRNYFVP